jgi:hypothetical protein
MDKERENERTRDTDREWENERQRTENDNEPDDSDMKNRLLTFKKRHAFFWGTVWNWWSMAVFWIRGLARGIRNWLFVLKWSPPTSRRSTEIFSFAERYEASVELVVEEGKENEKKERREVSKWGGKWARDCNEEETYRESTSLRREIKQKLRDSKGTCAPRWTRTHNDKVVRVAHTWQSKHLLFCHHLVEPIKAIGGQSNNS